MIKHLRVLTISIIVGLSIVFYLLFSQLGELPKLASNPLLYLISTLISAIAGLTINSISNLLIGKIIPWKSRVQFRLIVEFIVCFTVIILLSFGAIWGIKNYSVLLVQGDNVDMFEAKARLIILAFIISFTYALAKLLLYSYYAYTKQKVDEIKQRREQIELQFDALRSQLSPHFLFNNLNTIYSLIHTNPQQADTYIRMLTQTYHYILTTNEKKVVTLREELFFNSIYCNMLDIRFGKAITVKVDIDDSVLETFIPPLSLQILVENAVKHNAFSEKNPLQIDIKSERNSIIVANNITPASEKHDSFRIGLNNIITRYAKLVKQPVVIDSHTQFIVKLPVIVSINKLVDIDLQEGGIFKNANG